MIYLWTIVRSGLVWLRTIVRLRRRTFIPRRRLASAVRLRSWLRPVTRRRLIHRGPIVRSRLGRLRTIVGLRYRTIIPCRRLESAVRLSIPLWPVIRLGLIHCRAIVRSRLIRLRPRRLPICRHRSRPVSRLIRSGWRRHRTRRSHDIHSRCSVHRGRRCHPRQLLTCYRLARMLREHLLPRRERRRRRRRRCSGDNCPIRNRCRWCRHVTGSVGMCA